MQCPSCEHEAPAIEFGDPLRCPDCGIFYEKALLSRQAQKPGSGAREELAVPAQAKNHAVPETQIPGYIKASLSSGESVEAIFRLHWAAWIEVWAWVVFSILTAGLLAPIAIYKWLVLRSLEQGLTNKRVIVKRGIISRKTEEMKLTSIETVELSQGVLGRIFGFGDVKVTGRGISDVVYQGIDDPMQVKRRIESVSHPVS